MCVTIEEIKEKYGEADGYISCIDCPLNSSKCNPQVATGYEECWREIQKHFANNQNYHNRNNKTSAYWERIEAIESQQRKKGLAKYGQGLEMNPAAMCERIRHLEEELIDALMYCEWIKEKLRELGDNNGS